MEQTYNEAAKFILENFNMTRLGCLFYGLDYEVSTERERNNAGKKIKSRLENAKPKFMQKLLSSINFEFISDQQKEQLREQLKR